MGRSLSGAFGAGPSNTVSQGVFNLKAGVAVVQNDLLQLGPNGKAYPVKVTDYAAVPNMAYGTEQTTEATGRIVAQTQVVAGQTVAYYRQAVLQAEDGDIYTLTCNSGGSQGLVLSRYSSTGGLISSVVLDAAETSYYSHHILLLSDGNIAVAAQLSGSSINYAVYDANLNQIKGLTSASGTGAFGTHFSMCALIGGGFAITYQPSASNLTSVLTTFDNTGTLVLAPTTIWTRTGTNGAQYHKMIQLSDGNLAIAVASTNTVSSIGLFHGIVTITGASVLAFTNLNTTSISSIPELLAINGNYCVAQSAAAGQIRGYVFDNSGLLQGSGFSDASAGGSLRFKLTSDGIAFYLIWPRSSDTVQVLTKLPIGGTGYLTTVLRGGSNIYNLPIDAFIENELVTIVTQPTGAFSPVLWVARLDSGYLVSQLSTSFGVDLDPTTGGQHHRVIPGGDFSFICLYDYAGTAATNLAVGKYANTAVIGVAQGAAAADALVPTATPAGGYSCNQLAGSPTKSFDHSAANIYGNKGAMLTYGVTLKGM